MCAACKGCALLLLASTLRGAWGGPAAVRGRTTANPTRNATATQAKERRLWGFQWPDGVPDPNKLTDEAGKFVDKTQQEAGQLADNAGKGIGDAAGHAGGAIGDAAGQAGGAFNFVKDTFNNAKSLVEEGLRVVTSASAATSQFSEKMNTLFQEFAPLQPIFGATHGMVPLLTSQKNLGTLVNFLVDLLENAAELAHIGNAVSTVSSIFDQLFNLFNQELSHLSGVADGRRLFVDYTSLLGDLNFEQLKSAFEDFGRRAQVYVNQVKSVNETMSPLLREVKKHLNTRRLNAQDALEELRANQLRYEGAILSVVPTWQSVENLAIDVCAQTDQAMREVSSLQCRVNGFASSVQLPGAGGVQNIVDGCEAQLAQDASANAGQGDQVQCPGAAQSANVRDMLSDSAGVLGWIAVTFEYMIRNSTATRILFATLILILGIALAFFGYRYKDCEFWVEGLLAGFVVWSIVVSVIIVYFGVCRGKVIDSCEPRWLLLVVCLLAIGCAVTTVKAQKIQLFLAGFDLGAILGGFLYVSQYHEQIFHTFVTVNSQEAKVIMAGLLGAALLVGLVTGALTVFFEKLVLVVGTAAIGGFLMVIAFSLYLPHWLGWGDLIGWLLLTLIASVAQYMVTAPGDGDKSGDEEGSPLFG